MAKTKARLQLSSLQIKMDDVEIQLRGEKSKSNSLAVLVSKLEGEVSDALELHSQLEEVRSNESLRAEENKKLRETLEQRDSLVQSLNDEVRALKSRILDGEAKLQNLKQTEVGLKKAMSERNAQVGHLCASYAMCAIVVESISWHPSADRR